MITDKINAKGSLVIILKDRNGNVKSKTEHKNLVVTTGKEAIAARLASDSSAYSPMAIMKIGSGSADPTVDDVGLQSVLGTANITSTEVASNVVTYSATFDPGVGTGAVVEAGIFSDDSPEVMLCRTTFDVVNKSADDVITIFWNITIV